MLSLLFYHDPSFVKITFSLSPIFLAVRVVEVVKEGRPSLWKWRWNVNVVTGLKVVAWDVARLD